jgi:hypothetical protein
MKTYIYTLEHPETKEIKYIGKTNNPQRRLRHHLAKKKSKCYVNSWLDSLKNKGLKPIMTIIDETEEDWQSLEIYWIAQFKAWGFNLCNHTLGGEGAYGSGKWNNVPVSLYHKDGEFIKSFESGNHCASYLKTTRENVGACLNGRNILLLKKYQVRKGTSIENIGNSKNRKDYQWKNKPHVHWISKKVKCVEDDIVFNSVSEAANYYNILSTSISNILKGRAKKLRNGKTFVTL